MADVFSKTQRSKVMAAIRGKGNRSTEWRLRARFIASGISGWRMHPAEIPGKPDFVFLKKRIAIFVDGCFWHGCGLCRNIPRSNRSFWENKIEKNRKRDRKISRQLKKSGWQVLRFWEHDLKKRPAECCRKIQDLLSAHHTRIQNRS